MKQTTKSVVMVCPYARLFFRFGAGGGAKASTRRSINARFSTSDPRTSRHSRDCGCFAILSSASLRRRSSAKSCEPSISQTSSLSSSSRRGRGRTGRHVVEIVDEMSGMNFEEPREKETGGCGHVRARAALELGEVGLADRAVLLLADRLSRPLPASARGPTRARILPASGGGPAFRRASLQSAIYC